MSTETTQRQNDVEASDGDPYTPVSGVKDLETDDLLRMQSPDALVEEGVQMFAVAARRGVMTLADGAHQFEATVVLYLSADSEYARERYFRRGLCSAPRACIVPEEQLSEAGPGARSREHLLSNHPEVEDV